MIANTNTVFDIYDLFKQIHGYTPAHIGILPNQIDAGTKPYVQAITQKTHNLYGQPLYGKDDFGNEVFCPITIEVAGKDYYFPHAVIGLSRTKNIVFTEMSELQGSVKEIISNNDFDITIKGFLIGQYEQFPDEKLKMLNDVFEYNQAVRLKSAFSDIFLHANDKVLITKLDIPEKSKVIGVRDFTLQMLSYGMFTIYVD